MLTQLPSGKMQLLEKHHHDCGGILPTISEIAVETDNKVPTNFDVPPAIWANDVDDDDDVAATDASDTTRMRGFDTSDDNVNPIATG